MKLVRQEDGLSLILLNLAQENMIRKLLEDGAANIRINNKLLEYTDGIAVFESNQEDICIFIEAVISRTNGPTYIKVKPCE